MGICEESRLPIPRQRSPGLNVRTRDAVDRDTHSTLQNTSIYEYVYYIVWIFLEPPGLPIMKIMMNVGSSHKTRL